MRTLVIGAGALGRLFYGACLTRAGRDVTFLVRPQRARAGSFVTDFASPLSKAISRSLPPPSWRANSATPFDLILVGVKSYSLGEAMEKILVQLSKPVDCDFANAQWDESPRQPDRAFWYRTGAGAAWLRSVQRLDSEGRIIHFGGSELCVR